MKPIRIYLDTSDYINMFNARSGSIEFEVKEKLLKWVDKNTIEIGYSYWLITEFIKDGDAQHDEDRRNKGKFIKSLTEGKSFPYPIDIKLGAKFPNDGIWLPRNIFDQFDSKKFITKQRERILTDKRFNREARRKFATLSGLQQHLKRTGYLLNLTQQDFAPLPVSDEFLAGRYMEKYMRGEISKEEFQRRLVQCCSDSEEYFGTFHTKLKLDSPIDEMVRNFYDGFADWATKVIAHNANSTDIYRRHKKIKRDLHNSIRKSGLPAEVTKVLPPIESPKAPAIVTGFNFSDIATKIFPFNRTAYIDEYVTAVLDGLKVERSDIVDLMHIQYVFDCDLLRCDRKMWRVFSKSPTLPAGKLVGKLTDLPDRIEQMLAPPTLNSSLPIPT